MTGWFFSVRMRASAGAAHEEGGLHISGGERLVPEGQEEAAALELLRRPRRRELTPDFVQLTLERFPQERLRWIRALPIRMQRVSAMGDSRLAARHLLEQVGIAKRAIKAAIDGLSHGFDVRETPLRGAALLDADTGERRDPDLARGVRASHFDYAPGQREAVSAALAAQGLTHFRTLDALAVASKVAWSGVLAEICWSDEPGYAAGYLASGQMGYLRYPDFKPEAARGGRVFFVRGDDAHLQACIQRLEAEPVLIEGPFVVVDAGGSVDHLFAPIMGAAP